MSSPGAASPSPRARGVGVRDPAVDVDENGLREVLDEPPVACLARLERRLGALARGDVAEAPDDRADVRVVEQVRARALQPADGAVAVERANFLPGVPRPAAEDALDLGREARAVLGEDVVAPGAPAHLLGRPPQHAREPRAPVEGRAVGRGQRDRVGALLDDRAEAPLAASEFLLRGDPRGGLGADDQRSPDAAHRATLRPLLADVRP